MEILIYLNDRLIYFQGYFADNLRPTGSFVVLLRWRRRRRFDDAAPDSDVSGCWRRRRQRRRQHTCGSRLSVDCLLASRSPVRSSRSPFVWAVVGTPRRQPRVAAVRANGARRRRRRRRRRIAVPAGGRSGHDRPPPSRHPGRSVELERHGRRPGTAARAQRVAAPQPAVGGRQRRLGVTSTPGHGRQFGSRGGCFVRRARLEALLINNNKLFHMSCFYLILYNT